MKFLKPIGFVLIMAMILAFNQAKDKTTLYLIGDSTMSQKSIKAYPETGWGMPFTHFFDSTVVVENHAQNGRSTRTFIEENRWQPIVEKLQKGDYVFIQFGHNDEVATKKSYTTEKDFKANLLKFVKESRAKNAIPVLITPVARRKFNADGKIVDTHEVYAALVREVAQKNEVLFIDLSVSSMKLLQDFGVEKSAYLFNHLEAGQNTNYPNGKTDDTHFNEHGARRMAELVLQEINKQQMDLAKYIIK
ncbi:rhamnogalacturonan acetylesterase RhgT [Pedobacter glucosidilyticus]|uniref:Rhamnogalacturonan acetylesterase n=1 Tax=Pedobacter aquae TaxID=2605747 RepID=A0A5C0VK02_9SPHI|nr:MULTISPECIES: rhamnogalacturonan acetylesterase [Pedobacter]KHJ39328.1 rhamnogalacturonan acetylesterase RhgT [Pedobacter glucosidilyticus]QEK53058.1 rhamnogalacturonan acetylesterase [Pedobacter aquae]